MDKGSHKLTLICLQKHFTQKYPVQEELVEEILQSAIKALGLENVDISTGGVGFYQGVLDAISGEKMPASTCTPRMEARQSPAHDVAPTR